MVHGRWGNRCGLVLACALLMLLSACASPRARNVPLATSIDGSGRQPQGAVRADLTLWTSSTADKPFIGVAISGGGSRAAVFGWSVLQQLHAAGQLADVDALSSVSGGSLAAGLFALRGAELQTEQDWQDQQRLLQHDFLGDWLQRLLNPGMLMRSSFAGLTRTQLMAEVFDDVLFGKATYGDLGRPGPLQPQLFINATSSTDATVSRAFVFDNADFSGRLGSRLDRFPLSEAVIASGAFPGLFGNIPLRNFNERLIRPDTHETIAAEVFEQVYDGGASDNLGVWTLLRRARTLYQASVRQGKPLRGCLIIAVDAYAADFVRQLKVLGVDTDTSLLDLVVKPAAWDSIDALLYANRLRTLQALGLSTDDTRGERPRDRFVPIHVGEYAPGGQLAVTHRWRRVYDPVSRFPLYGPHLPWDEATLWADPGSERLDTRMMSDDEVAGLHRARMQRTLELQRQAPDCLLWHVTFDRLRSLADFVFDDSSALRLPAVPSTDAYRIDIERVQGAAGGSLEDLLVERRTERDAPLPGLGRTHFAELVNVNGFRQSLWALTARVDTSYRLVGPPHCTADFIGKGLQLASVVLVHEDRQSLDRVCDWYRSHGLATTCGTARRSHTLADLEQPWFSSSVRSSTGRQVPLFACEQPPTQRAFERAIRALEQP